MEAEKLDEIIKQLDEWLYKGYLLKTQTIDTWNLEKDQSVENLKKFRGNY